jgi:hypothetical protein
MAIYVRHSNKGQPYDTGSITSAWKVVRKFTLPAGEPGRLAKFDLGAEGLLIEPRSFIDVYCHCPRNNRAFGYSMHGGWDYGQQNASNDEFQMVGCQVTFGMRPMEVDLPVHACCSPVHRSLRFPGLL